MRRVMVCLVGVFMFLSIVVIVVVVAVVPVIIILRTHPPVCCRQPWFPHNGGRGVSAADGILRPAVGETLIYVQDFVLILGNK